MPSCLRHALRIAAPEPAFAGEPADDGLHPRLPLAETLEEHPWPPADRLTSSGPDARIEGKRGLFY